MLLGDQAVADFPPAWTAFGMNTAGSSFIPLPFLIRDRLRGDFHGAFCRLRRSAAAFTQSARIRWPRHFPVSMSRRSGSGFSCLSGTLGALAGIVYTLRLYERAGRQRRGLRIVGHRGGAVRRREHISADAARWSGVMLSLLIVGVLKNALTLDDVSSETLTIVTGALLLASVLIPNLVARWRAMRDRRFIARTPSSHLRSITKGASSPLSSQETVK